MNVNIARNSNSTVPKEALSLLEVASDFPHLRSGRVPEQMEAIRSGNFALDSCLLPWPDKAPGSLHRQGQGNDQRCWQTGSPPVAKRFTTRDDSVALALIHQASGLNEDN